MMIHCIYVVYEGPSYMLFMKASLVAQTVKNMPAIQKTGLYPRVEQILWRRKWPPTSAFLPGEVHGQRSLVTIVHRVAKSQT